MKPQINVQVDTAIIEDNTADGFAIILSEETPVAGDFVISPDLTIKGTGLTKVISTTVTQGDLKTKLASINNQIAALMTRQTEVQTLLDDVSVAVDTAIATAL